MPGHPNKRRDFSITVIDDGNDEGFTVTISFGNSAARFTTDLGNFDELEDLALGYLKERAIGRARRSARDTTN